MQSWLRLDACSQTTGTSSAPPDFRIAVRVCRRSSLRARIGIALGNRVAPRPQTPNVPQTAGSTSCANFIRSPPCAAMPSGPNCRRCSIALPSIRIPNCSSERMAWSSPVRIRPARCDLQRLCVRPTESYAQPAHSFLMNSFSEKPSSIETIMKPASVSRPAS